MCTIYPQWGNFIYHADMDLQAFACLNMDGIHALSKYHAVQSIEKYLKALALSIEYPTGKKSGEITQARKTWVKSHDLNRLAQRCMTRYPYYGSDNVSQILIHLSKLDQHYRYPWAEMQIGNFSSANDIESIIQLIVKLRGDIPIIRDDYPLGMLIRGGHQDQVSRQTWDINRMKSQSRVISALLILFNDIASLVRWGESLS